MSSRLATSSFRACSLARRGYSTAGATPPAAGAVFVKRVTLFKIPKEDDIDAVLRQYDVLKKTAVKDGKPYIVSNAARRVVNTASPRSEGFTLSSQSVFRSKEDHQYYDEECAAHKELKEVTAKVRTGIMTIVTEGEWPEPLN